MPLSSHVSSGAGLQPQPQQPPQRQAKVGGTGVGVGGQLQGWPALLRLGVAAGISSQKVLNKKGA